MTSSNKQIRLPENVRVFEYTKIIGLENVNFGDKGKIMIDDFVFINASRGKIDIGNYVHLSVGSSVSAGDSRVTLEDFSTVSQGCRLFAVSDDYKDEGFGNSTMEITYRNLKSEPIVMQMFSIIGANSVILPGVNIGCGASVGANSVVTRDLEPWGVYIGNHKVGNRNKKGILTNFEKFINKINSKDAKIAGYYRQKLEKLLTS